MQTLYSAILIIVNFARRQDYGLLCTFVAKVVTINKYTRMFSLRTEGGRGGWALTKVLYIYFRTFHPY